MKVLILGSSGIIGQHLRLCVPSGVTPVWHRKTVDCLHIGCNLTDGIALQAMLAVIKPDVIVNLAGESNTDVVEREPDKTRLINVDAVRELAEYCLFSGCHLVQVSTQAVFLGDNPPYSPHSPVIPVNEYGCQKAEAETIAKQAGNWTIIRPTFVLGVRPMPLVGRPNPVEQMLAGQSKQVCDRYFSPLFARDAAQLIWQIVTNPRPGEIIHLGNPVSASRHEIAGLLGLQTEPVSHGDFPGLAPRPVDTCYSEDSRYLSSIPQGLAQCKRDWQSRQSLDVHERAREIALFLGISEATAFERLSRGFHAAHADVADDFRRFAPKDDAALLNWYRTTEAYIWELSAYHADESGFNYSGMCGGIVQHLKSIGARRVLCLGDGIGDLSLAMKLAGLEPTYHDLAGSLTSAFAGFRFWLRCPSWVPVHETRGWDPSELLEGPEYDAVVSLDFMEHLVDLPAWVATIKHALKPGGYFMAVNSFDCGSGDNGSIPCHLARNDIYKEEFSPLLSSIGFAQLSRNWFRKVA